MIVHSTWVPCGDCDAPAGAACAPDCASRITHERESALASEEAYTPACCPPGARCGCQANGQPASAADYETHRRCDHCRGLVPLDDVVSCGLHTHCTACVPDAGCDDCALLVTEELVARADDRAYDAYRDREVA